MTAASLSLLKGGKKSTVADELEKPAAKAKTPTAPPPAAEKPGPLAGKTSEQLDALVAENEIETPKGWAKWNADKKREWLLATFDFEGSEDETEAEAVDVGDDADGDAEKPSDEAEDFVQTHSPDAEEPEQPAEAAEAQPAPVAAPAKAEKAKKPKKEKGTAVAAGAKTGVVEMPGDDLLADMVHEIENLKEKDALSLIPQLLDQAEITFFKLGGILSLVQANSWYAPHASMREFIENGLGLEYRKAMYWQSIYNGLVESGVPWEKVKTVPWTKLKEIVRVLTKENVDQWVQIAEEQNTITLIQTVKNHLAADKPTAIEDGKSKTIISKTFKVHSEQVATIDAAVAKAKEQTGTSSDAHALELICTDYLGGQTLAQKLQAMGVEAACEALEKAFPNANFSVEIPDEAEAA